MKGYSPAVTPVLIKNVTRSIEFGCAKLVMPTPFPRDGLAVEATTAVVAMRMVMHPYSQHLFRTCVCYRCGDLDQAHLDKFIQKFNDIR